MGLIKGIFKRLVNFLVFFFIIVLVPGFPPKTTFEFSPFSLDKPADFVGPLELNTYLDNAERLLEGRINGPENPTPIGKDIYTGLNTGELVKINGDHITHVAKFGEPCEGDWEPIKCGRPLGIVHDKQRNQLIVSDAYKGIFEVDVATGKWKNLVSPQAEIRGKLPRKAMLFNSVALHSSGDIYFTDSSSDFHLQDGTYATFANPSGRLIHFNRKTGVCTAVADELAFANGLVISPNEDFIVFAETVKNQLTKYHLTGPKKGQLETFITGLPGHPDNLTPSASGGFWSPLCVSWDDKNPSLIASLAPVPLVRKFLLRLHYLIEMPFKILNDVYPNMYAKKAINFFGNFMTVSFAFPARQTILKVNWDGKILFSLHGSDKSVHKIAHVAEFGDYILLGSPFTQYLGRVKLPKQFLGQPKQEEKAIPTTTTTTTPKPTTTTTTTPKPTTTTTTTPKPTTTTTTTPKPTTTTEKPTTTTPKPAPKTTIKPPATEEKPREPAPIHEKDRNDVPPPPPEKLKVIKRGNVQEEL